MPGLATDEKRSCYECTLGLVAKVSISLPAHYKQRHTVIVNLVYKELTSMFSLPFTSTFRCSLVLPSTGHSHNLS